MDLDGQLHHLRQHGRSAAVLHGPVRLVAPGSVVVVAANRVVPQALVEAFGPDRPFGKGMPGTPPAAEAEPRQEKAK